MDDTRKEEQSISINDMEYLPVTKSVKESLRVQKTEYIRQQMRKRQEYEESVMTQLLQEQRVIDGLQKKINENLEQTEASGKYNQEFKESINAQIYALHGISSDKLEGMREYKKAYYQGSAFALFLLSVAMILLCGMLHGFDSEICVFMLAYTGLEGALLAQEKKRWKIVDWLCRLMYLFMFPVMMMMFVCYELRYPWYGFFMPYAAAGGTGILVFAVISYFLYNPYRSVRKNVRNANVQIGVIEKTARKEVRRNQKLHAKEEKKADRQAAKEDRLQEKLVRRTRRRDSWKQFLVKIRTRTADLFHFQKHPDKTEPEAVTEETTDQSENAVKNTDCTECH